MNAYRHDPVRLATVPVNILTLCAEARELIASRRFEEAAELLSPAWPGVRYKPYTVGLSKKEAAEIMLLAGTLTAHIGRKRQIEGATESAKDLITASQTLFTELPDAQGAGRCLSELGLWYTREKSFNEAEVLLREALATLPEDALEDRVEAVFRLISVTDKMRRHDESLELMLRHFAVLDDPHKPDRRIIFHNLLSGTLGDIAQQTRRLDDINAALSGIFKAKGLAEAAGKWFYVAAADNNAAGVWKCVNRFYEAHAALDRAEAILTQEGATDALACVQETRTRTLLAEGRFTEAEAVVTSSLARMCEQEQRGHFAEMLLCAGEVAAELRRYEDARTYYLRATEAAQIVGDDWMAAEATRQLGRLNDARQFDEEANLASLWAARTFAVAVKTDAMEGAGMLNGRIYSFRRTRAWVEGDIVAANTPDCPTVAYIYDAPPSGVRLEWANEKYESRIYPRSAVRVIGVLELE